MINITITINENNPKLINFSHLGLFSVSDQVVHMNNQDYSPSSVQSSVSVEHRKIDKIYLSGGAIINVNSRNIIVSSDKSKLIINNSVIVNTSDIASFDVIDKIPVLDMVIKYKVHYGAPL